MLVPQVPLKGYHVRSPPRGYVLRLDLGRMFLPGLPSLKAGVFFATGITYWSRCRTTGGGIGLRRHGHHTMLYTTGSHGSWFLTT